MNDFIDHIDDYAGNPCCWPGDGILQLGSDAGATGLLVGSYAVPAPGAAALLALSGLISRRRKA